MPTTLTTLGCQSQAPSIAIAHEPTIGTLVQPMVASLSVKYPEFGARVKAAMESRRLTNYDVQRALGVSLEMVRRYRNGQAMPDDPTLRKLAAMLGVSIHELRYGERKNDSPISASGEDERAILHGYRRLPDYAQKALRAHLVELLEQFGPKDKDNPFAKGGTQ